MIFYSILAKYFFSSLKKWDQPWSCFLAVSSGLNRYATNLVWFYYRRFVLVPMLQQFLEIWYVRLLPGVRDFFIWNKFSYNSFRDIIHLSIFRICFEEAKLHFSPAFGSKMAWSGNQWVSSLGSVMALKTTSGVASILYFSLFRLILVLAVFPYLLQTLVNKMKTTYI